MRAAYYERAARARAALIGPAADVRRGVLRLVEWLAHAARVVLEKAAVHHELYLLCLYLLSLYLV